jgi:uncharacterized Zn finger protein
VSPPRRIKGNGGGEKATPDLDELRARLAKAHAESQRGRPSTGRRRRRRAPAGEDDGWPPLDDLPTGEQPDDPSSGPWWAHEEAGRPRPVVGGIAARTRKGPIGATWWSRRFLGSLESSMVGGRMERGRSYARRGQIVDLRIEAGEVVASVQGSREDPYVVRLRMPVVPQRDWDRIVDALAARAGYAARMLAGELPHEVEQVFEDEGASLLPAPHARLVTECTCPDWENPCKHVAAVCYLVAEEFDRDPFALLAWRGRGREEVLSELRARRRAGAGPEPAAEAEAVESAGPEGEPATDLLTRFWVAGPELAHVRVHPEEAPVPTAALRLAPRGTISVRGGDLVDVLAPAYRAIAASAAARARR